MIHNSLWDHHWIYWEDCGYTRTFRRKYLSLLVESLEWYFGFLGRKERDRLRFGWCEGQRVHRTQVLVICVSKDLELVSSQSFSFWDWISPLTWLKMEKQKSILWKIRLLYRLLKKKKDCFTEKIKECSFTWWRYESLICFLFASIKMVSYTYIYFFALHPHVWCVWNIKWHSP